MSSEKINLLLIGDPIIREGIKSLLLRDEELTIKGEINDGSDAIAMLNQGIKADIVIIDSGIADNDSFKYTRIIKEAFPKIKVVLLSNQSGENYVIDAFKAGANGYLLKSISHNELLFALKHIHFSSDYLCSQMMVRFINRLTAIPELSPVKGPAPNFTGRELEILTLISHGFTNHQIAEKLFTSKRTIENYRQALINKTGSKNIVSLVRFAVINGLIT